jgi:hypothetical protein
MSFLKTPYKEKTIRALLVSLVLIVFIWITIAKVFGFCVDVLGSG